MRTLMLLAGVSALTLAMPAAALDQDRGRGGGRGQAAEAEHKGGGHGRADRSHGRDQQARGERRGRSEARAERRGRGEARSERRGRGNADRAERRLDRQERRVERAIQQQRRDVRQARRDDRRFDGRRDEARRQVSEAREDRRDWRRWAERRRTVRDRFDDDFRRWRDERRPRFARSRNFCPPGLARQNRFCMPPGQLRKARLIGQRLPIARSAYNVPVRYRYRFLDGDDWFYRYDDRGYVYRFDRGNGLVDAVYPLFGSSLLVGEPLPLGYEVYNLPLAYRSYYPDTPQYRYRYDDGAIYQVDAETSLIEGIVALLTGGVGGLGGLGVGDRLPAGYDVYNVPLDYRDTYYDSDDSMYRYADGAIYRVDPQTRLIESVISLLT